MGVEIRPTIEARRVTIIPMSTCNKTKSLGTTFL